MAQTTQTWFTTTLAKKLLPWDTTMELATAPTITKWRCKVNVGDNSEWIKFTGLTGSTLTGLVRGLSKTAVPATSGTGLTHPAGTVVKIVIMHDQLLDKQEDESLSWTITVPSIRFSDTTTSWLRLKSLTEVQRDALTPATGDQIFNSTSGTVQTYYGGTWNDNASGTTANASTTVAGKVEIATTTQSKAATDTWETGASLSVLPSDIAKNIQSGTFLYCGASSAWTDTYVVAATPSITEYTTGMKISFLADVANTWASTINLNWLWAKSILTSQWYNIETWYILANQIVNLTYNWTGFFIDNPVWPVPHDYWDWSDWDVTISGTITLTKDMYYNNLSIPAGQTLNPAWYRVFVRGIMSGTWTINRNGNAWNAWAPITAWTAATILGQWTLNAEVTSSGNWWNWTTSGSWTNGTAWTASNPSLSNVNWSAWGWGGWYSWATWSSSWGGWSTTTRWSLYQSLYFPHYVHPATAQATFWWLNYKNSGTAWGWGGGWSGWSGNGWGWGGWGGNGWLIWIACNIWNFTWTVTATGWAGWAGANGTTSWTATWGWGGWGGGNGWILFRIYRTIVADATITLTWGSWWAAGTWAAWWSSWVAWTAWSTWSTISLQVV